MSASLFQRPRFAQIREHRPFVGALFNWDIAITGTSGSLASSFICRHPGRSAGYAAGPVARVTEAD